MSSSFAQAWQDYKPLLCIGGVYALLCAGLAFWLGISVKGFIGWTWMATRHTIGLAYVFLMLVMLGAFLREICIARCNLRKAGTAFGAWFRGYLAGTAFAGGLCGLLVAYESLFFIIQKSNIRRVNPYAWDQVFGVWDKAVHFGRHPYEYLFALFAGRGFEWYLQGSYVGWFFFMYVGLGFCLFCDADRWRKQQFIAVFFFVWTLLGGVAATVFSSAGPVFCHALYPALPDIYKPLTDYFVKVKDSIGGITYITQSLLEWHRSPGIITPSGLSAMPSMHAAISTLVILYARSVNRYAFALAFIFGGSVIVSSIFFGYHYAIDSYASILAVSLMWWAAGKYYGRRKALEEKA